MGQRVIAASIAAVAATFGTPAVAGTQAVATGPSAVAFAAPSTAEERYASARKAYDAGEFSAAATLFVEAFELSKDPNLLYNAAAAFEAAGDLGQAIEYYDRYRAVAPAAEAAELEAQLDTLRRRVAAQSAPPRDDEPTKDVGPNRDEGGRRDDPQKLFGPGAIVLTATTAVATGVAVGMGIAALAKKNSAENACLIRPEGTICPGQSGRDDDTRRKLALGADISIGIAVVSAIATVAVVVTNARRRKTDLAKGTSARWQISPAIGRTAASLSVGRRF